MQFRLKTLGFIALIQLSVASYAFSLPSLPGSSIIRKFLSSSYSFHFENFEDVTPEELELYLDKIKSKGAAVVPDLKEALSWWFESHEEINEEWKEYYLTKSGKKIRPVKELRRLFLTGISGVMPFDYSVWKFEVCNPDSSSSCNAPSFNIAVKVLADPSVENHGRWFKKYHLKKIDDNLKLVKKELAGTPLIFGKTKIKTPTGVKKLAILCEDTGDDFRDTKQLPDFTDPTLLRSLAIQSLKIIEQYIQLGMYTEAIAPKHFSYRNINGKKQLILSDLELGVNFEEFLDSGNGPIQFGKARYFPLESFLSNQIYTVFSESPDYLSLGPVYRIKSRQPQYSLSFILAMVFADELSKSSGYGAVKRYGKHWGRLNTHESSPENFQMVFDTEIKEVAFIKKHLDKISRSSSTSALSKQIEIIKNMLTVPQEKRITVSQALQEFQRVKI